MHLVIGAQHLPVAQVGPDFVILKKPIDFGPTQAELIVQIDGTEKRRKIFLPQGSRVTDAETPVASL